MKLSKVRGKQEWKTTLETVERTQTREAFIVGRAIDSWWDRIIKENPPSKFSQVLGELQETGTDATKSVLGEQTEKSERNGSVVVNLDMLGVRGLYTALHDYSATTREQIVIMNNPEFTLLRSVEGAIAGDMTRQLEKKFPHIEQIQIDHRVAFGFSRMLTPSAD